MRHELLQLIDLGPLPDSSSPDIVRLEKQEMLIKSLVAPATDEEACAAISLFGPDECFGLAWSLLHFVETAPSWPIWNCLQDETSTWVRCLRERAHNAGLGESNGG